MIAAPQSCAPLGMSRSRWNGSDRDLIHDLASWPSRIDHDKPSSRRDGMQVVGEHPYRAGSGSRRPACGTRSVGCTTTTDTRKGTRTVCEASDSTRARTWPCGRVQARITNGPTRWHSHAGPSDLRRQPDPFDPTVSRCSSPSLVWSSLRGQEEGHACMRTWKWPRPATPKRRRPCSKRACRRRAPMARRGRAPAPATGNPAWAQCRVQGPAPPAPAE